MTTKAKFYIAAASIGLLALATGIYWQLARQAVPADPLYQQALSNLEQQPVTLEQFRGKVVVVNFWATWCAPCREEMPEFVTLQRQYQAQGLQFVGIALDEPEPVKSFAQSLGINYPIWLGNNIGTMEAMRTSGNQLGALPYTLVFDRQGQKVKILAGRVHGSTLEGIIKPLLAQP
jgi:thiol-disulfide isomerase/thioredoxin